MRTEAVRGLPGRGDEGCEDDEMARPDRAKSTEIKALRGFFDELFSGIFVFFFGGKFFYLVRLFVYFCTGLSIVVRRDYLNLFFADFI
ncbi:hypothetical protein IFR09_03620 [Pseudomonas syringae]|nr:hypothetical protein [Pseudomonas syringae]MBD8791393.1 hypothetical protein [Pseudomonas syringae]MBD8801473.1 hypothetical protein [Pseudomonas syringae]MBD8810250.1 hypothetical protein [Pseudomonas syringae]